MKAKNIPNIFHLAPKLVKVYELEFFGTFWAKQGVFLTNPPPPPIISELNANLETSSELKKLERFESIRSLSL